MSTLELSQILGNYGEFVGAIAVVLTLIYLTIQIRQNTKTTMATVRQGRAAHASNLAELFSNSPYLPEINEKLVQGQDVDDVERSRFYFTQSHGTATKKASSCRVRTVCLNVHSLTR